MPYLSRAQQGWAHTPTGTKALGGVAKVAEWDNASRGMKLPKRVDGPGPSPVTPKQRARIASLKSRKPPLPKSAGHIVFGSLAPTEDAE